MSKNWAEEVEEYKKQYDDDEGIHEYVESLLPVYYGDIYQTYHELLGTPLNIEIEEQHVGISFWKILNHDINIVYYDLFMEAWNDAKDED
tara:strand:+ start:398 stop:667 length:270 start_codon:yes stop_codon:yes gene_type:complete